MSLNKTTFKHDMLMKMPPNSHSFLFIISNKKHLHIQLMHSTRETHVLQQDYLQLPQL